MASQKSKRKRRNAGSAPRAVPSRRRESRADREVQAAREQRRERRQGAQGTLGVRPPSPFGGVPVSEIAIFSGLVALVVWFFSRGTATLVVGLVVCTLGVLEVTGREHLSGYRSHTTLLAAIPSLAAGIGLVSLLGIHRDRAPVLLAIALPLFALLAWFLRARFRIARQARIVHPPRA